MTATAAGTATGLLQRLQGTGAGLGVGTAAAHLEAAAGAHLGGPLGAWTGTGVAWTGTGATLGPLGALTGVAAAGCRHHQGAAAAAGECLVRVLQSSVAPSTPRGRPSTPPPARASSARIIQITVCGFIISNASARSW